MPQPRITELTLYPALMHYIQQAGGSSVQEVTYNSRPDILFELNGEKWLLSVKIGDDTATLKSAFVQYMRHKQESRLRFGLLLLFPETIRSTRPVEREVLRAVRECDATVLVDTPDIKEELRNRAFPGVLRFLNVQLAARIRRRETHYYPLASVVSLLQQQVSEMMSAISLDEHELMAIITRPDLLADLGHLKGDQPGQVSRFLASYIVLSQILFLRLLCAASPSLFPQPELPISRSTLSGAFQRVLDVNYRPIYALDVLRAVPGEYLEDTFHLIWGLEIERVRHDLPGRIFHSLMPEVIRKMLAAFYTRPLAADILAGLAIDRYDCQVFDPACGSGTILVSAYKRKLQLFEDAGREGNPHTRFTENEIFGADIMPFAVHLTSANLAALDPATAITRTQIIQGDSLQLAPGTAYPTGLLQTSVFPTARTGATMQGDMYEVPLDQVDVVLMNPPFTKVERRIGDLVDMSRYADVVGGEVGLWGHFIALAQHFLRLGGMMAAVLPINVLRGRESARARDVLFERMSPLYILKLTRNYGFSEWAEYRDILLIARREFPSDDHSVKVCFIKRDITMLTDQDVRELLRTVAENAEMRSPELDINTYSMTEMKERCENMMWFCGGVDMAARDSQLALLDAFEEKLSRLPSDCLQTGYRPAPAGVSKFLFITRRTCEARVEQAFLTFEGQTDTRISAQSPAATEYELEREDFELSLRTPVGVSKIDITNEHDYLAKRPYRQLGRVMRAVGSSEPNARLWTTLEREIVRARGRLAVTRRINPFSPNMHLCAFYSDEEFSPSDLLHVIRTESVEMAKALCVVLNSVVFLTQFFLGKEESTGRYIDIRFYDLMEMELLPRADHVGSLASVFEDYRSSEFPALSNQFDTHYPERYSEFRETRDLARDEGRTQVRLWSTLANAIEPHTTRIDYDLDVCRALNVSVSETTLRSVYSAFVNEMLLIRALRRD